MICKNTNRNKSNKKEKKMTKENNTAREILLELATVESNEARFSLENVNKKMNISVNYDDQLRYTHNIDKTELVDGEFLTVDGMFVYIINTRMVSRLSLAISNDMLTMLKTYYSKGIVSVDIQQSSYSQEEKDLMLKELKEQAEAKVNGMQKLLFKARPDFRYNKKNERLIVPWNIVTLISNLMSAFGVVSDGGGEVTRLSLFKFLRKRNIIEHRDYAKTGHIVKQKGLTLEPIEDYLTFKWSRHGKYKTRSYFCATPKGLKWIVTEYIDTFFKEKLMTKNDGTYGRYLEIRDTLEERFEEFI